jgi:hypothetical protein
MYSRQNLGLFAIIHNKQGWQMKDEDEGILHLDEELSLSSTFIQDERIN